MCACSGCTAVRQPGWAHLTAGPKDFASSATAASLPSWEMKRGNLVLQGKANSLSSASLSQAARHSLLVQMRTLLLNTVWNA